MLKRLSAEFLGTFWLVLGGCGSAVLAANFGGDGNPLGIGLLGVSLAFGLTVLTGAYALGHISGGHFNPAVSFGLWAGGRFSAKDLLPYMIVQVTGAITAGFILLQIASGGPDFAVDPTAAGTFASNGYGALSPGGYSAAAAFLCEVVLTAFFMVVILGATHPRAPAGFGPIAIGLALTLIHLISIPVTNTSVNPARSTGVALFAGSGAIGQLWMFWLAPILGGLIGGSLYKWLGQHRD
jgi:aquaporin Z